MISKKLTIDKDNIEAFKNRNPASPGIPQGTHVFAKASQTYGGKKTDYFIYFDDAGKLTPSEIMKSIFDDYTYVGVTSENLVIYNGEGPTRVGVDIGARNVKKMIFKRFTNVAGSLLIHSKVFLHLQTGLYSNNVINIPAGIIISANNTQMPIDPVNPSNCGFSQPDYLGMMTMDYDDISPSDNYYFAKVSTVM